MSGSDDADEMDRIINQQNKEEMIAILEGYGVRTAERNFFSKLVEP